MLYKGDVGKRNLRKYVFYFTKHSMDVSHIAEYFIYLFHVHSLRITKMDHFKHAHVCSKTKIKLPTFQTMYSI